MIHLSTNAADLGEAARLLADGKLVAFPTETVYGLGVDAANADAVERVFVVKGRPADHPVIVHLPEAGAMPAWACEIPETAWRLAAAFWPGPLTLVLKRAEGVSDAITGGQDTVGLRVPGHPVARALLEAFGGALAAPSANRFGRISPTTAEHVMAEFDEGVAAVVDGGPCEVGIESTIVDLSGKRPALLRPGMLGAEQISEVLGCEVQAARADTGPRVSGRLESHYAPQSPAEIVTAAGLTPRLRELLGAGQRVAVLARRPGPTDLPAACEWSQMPADAAAYARVLYAELRRADASGANRILIESPPGHSGWRAVSDRLYRAVANP